MESRRTLFNIQSEPVGYLVSSLAIVIYESCGLKNIIKNSLVDYCPVLPQNVCLVRLKSGHKEDYAVIGHKR